MVASFLKYNNLQTLLGTSKFESWRWSVLNLKGDDGLKYPLDWSDPSEPYAGLDIKSRV